MEWTADKVEIVKELWESGQSASYIAMRIGGGISRNAVIGIIHRKRLSGRKCQPQRPFRPNKAARPRKPNKMSPLFRRRISETFGPEPFVPLPAPEIPVADRIPILTRKDDGTLHANEALTDDTCRWPCGDVGTPEFGFCPHPKLEGVAYCLDHARIAYQAPRPRGPRASQPAPTIKREKVAA